jgi:hypothetical protein
VNVGNCSGVRWECCLLPRWKTPGREADPLENLYRTRMAAG